MGRARHHATAPTADDRAQEHRASPTPPAAGLLHLQRAAGNAAVARHVQRYAVGVPATADHATLMGWLTTKNPYAPDSAAKTDAKFRYKVAWVAKGEPGSWIVTPAAGAAVTMTKTVDMPVWVAKDPKLQQEWAAGVAALRTHEGAHEALAATWKTTLEGRLAAFSTTSAADNETGAGKDASAELATQWQTWLDEHQAAQEALDPYAVTVTDPYPKPAPAPTTDAGE
jgi:predicted secreted Zn-dependent protease